jgi:flagellar basal-body rod modification protein FlgD
MTSVTSLTSTGGPAAGTQAQAAPSLGKDDFLKLFVAQLQHQDPMNPMQDAEFMGQMAQFSTLEQITNVAKANDQIATNLGISQSLGLLGRTVTYVDDQKVSHTGVVEKVVTEGGLAKLTINGVAGIDPASIAEVSDTSSPATPNQGAATP